MAAGVLTLVGISWHAVSDATPPVLFTGLLRKQLIQAREQLTAFVKKHHNNADSDSFDWSVNVVVGNSHVKKSLEVITELEIAGKSLEFDFDQFGKLRHQLSSAVAVMEK